MQKLYRIGISNDFKTEAPGRLEPVLADVLDPLPYVEYEYFQPSARDGGVELVVAQDVADYDAVLVLMPRFTAQSLAENERLAVIARWGVGYDRIDVDACTAADVALAITVDAVRRPVAEAVVTLMLAQAKYLAAKDRVVRSGRWDQRAAQPAQGIRGKVFGMVGVGNIGADVFRLLEPFGLGRKLAYDPYARPQLAQELGIELVDVETLFRESDFVSLNCPLTDETRGMVNQRLLNLMKPSAFLINTARGPVVAQDDLVQALQSGRIAGAALDVFESEPLPADHPLTRLDNVILSPHTLAWTDDLYRDNGVGACENILAVLEGRPPRYTVNKEVLERPGFRAKLAALAARRTA
jgi:phosphoglycerate dehydrogenase-like enzyme